MQVLISNLRYIVFVLLLGLTSISYAQILNPVKWSFESESLGDGEFMLRYTAKIDEGWNVYSQFTPDDGPVPTSITYEELEGVELVGESAETGHKKEGFDKIFEIDVIKFLDDEDYVISQKVKLNNKSASIAGYLTFMTCDDERCLPPEDVDFNFSLSNPSGNTNSSSKSDDNQQLNELSGFNIETESDQNEKNPASWTYKMSQKGDREYIVRYTAEILKGWYIYSQEELEDGPYPTTIEFENLTDVELVGKASESGEEKSGYDPIFELQLTKYGSAKPFVLEQTFKQIGDNPVASGFIEYMTCDDERCIMNTVDFYFDFAKGIISNQVPALTNAGIVLNKDTIDQLIPRLSQTFESPLAICGGETQDKNSSMLWMLILGFLGGLVALLTPCVFPMIPLTVSYFTKDTKRKGWLNGTIYGVSIIVIYVTIGLALTAFFGEEALNRLSTNWIANTLFFLIFLAFAFSFFGFYEITLPSSWANKSDRIADKGGLIGIFFMAFTLALVSFSCTGPIIGSAIVQAASNQVGPFIVMFGFALALALPFGFFAAFPSWLNSLPQSGSWMNSVKVVLGFLELALAFKFLSVADMTNHWNFLKYELFLGLWVLIFGGLTLYLFGFIKFPHDSPLKRLSKTRWAFALGSLVLTVYLVTGFQINDTTKSYNSLALMSGLAPPANYNFFLPPPSVDEEIKARFPSYSKCANNINCFKDYYEGLTYAKEQNKPILLDHTGYGCVNCRKTEEHIWIDQEVRRKLIEEFVLISLYVDDDKKLDKTLISKSRNKKIRNIGNKWADFQIVNFKQNSQPLYVMITPEEEVIAAPRGYKEGIEDYNEYLECGLNYFTNGD